MILPSTPKILLLLYFIFSIFPYIKILPINTDLQPNAAIVGSAILFLSPNKFSSIQWYTFVFGFVSIAILFLPYDPYHYSILGVIRGFGSILSFILCVIVWDSIDLKAIKSVVNQNSLITVLGVYIFCGLLQMFYDPDLFTIVLSRPYGYAGNEGRGVESLTAEPTYLAIQCIFIMRFARVIRPECINVASISLSSFLILYIAKSTTVVATLVAVAIVISVPITIQGLVSRGLKKIWLVAILVTLLFTATIGISSLSAEQNRVVTLFAKFINSGIAGLVESDWSVRDRLNHIDTSIGLSFQDWLRPHGYGMFQSLINEYKSPLIRREYIDFADPNGRIMSGYGGVLFEFGWFAIIPIFMVTRNFFSPNNFFENMFWAILLTGVLIQSVPLANPLVAYLASRHAKQNC